MKVLATLQELADVLDRLNYDDRMEFAGYIGEAARAWVEDEQEIGNEYFATLLTSFVEENLATDGDLSGPVETVQH